MHTPKAQQGFIQNFILPGLIVLGAVITGILWLAHSDTSTSADQDSMSAMVIIAQAAKLQTGIDRAVADGTITHDLTGVVDLETTLMQSAIMPQAAFPTPPALALLRPATWSYAQRYFRVLDARESSGDIGTAALDDVVYLPHLTAYVCAQLNYRLHGSSTLLESDGSYRVTGVFDMGDAQIQGANNRVAPNRASQFREGCVRNAGWGDYVYYKTIGVH